MMLRLLFASRRTRIGRRNGGRAGAGQGGTGSIGHGEEGEEDDRRDHAAAAKSSNDLFSSGRDSLGRFSERPANGIESDLLQEVQRNRNLG